MSQMTIDILELVGVLLLIALNAFFVSAEFALVSVRRTRIEEMISRGNAAARVAKRVIGDPDRLIATTQLGITVASLGLGWLGEPALAHLLEPVFSFLPQNLVTPTTEILAASALAFVVITFLHVLMGELVPKSITLSYPEQTALTVARPIAIVETLFHPATWALSHMGNAVLKLLGLTRPRGHQMVHSVDELKMLVTASTASGELEPVESQIVHRAFEFADRDVVEVMIPRTDIVAIEDAATVDNFLKVFEEVSHSRFPVYADNLDNIVGFVWVKDILRALARDPNARSQNVKTLTRNALFVPSTKHIGELFAEMQRQRIQLAIVIDEYGGTAGMVTIEEMIEEVVGSVSDELTSTAPSLRKVDDARTEVDATLRIGEINAQLGVDLPESDDYETLAGLILTKLGRVPKEGDSIQVGKVKLIVTAMEGPRIEKVLLEKIPKVTKPADAKKA
jgi:CBS domain containing-hemolysin-like protein